MSYNAARRRRGLEYRMPEPSYWGLTVTTSSGGQNFYIEIVAGTSIDITVDWGDGTSNTYKSTGSKSHKYTDAGTYLIKVSGSIVNGHIRIGGTSSDKARLQETGVIGGITGLIHFTDTFSGCTGLTSLPADLFKYHPTVADNAFNSTFTGCTGLTTLRSGLFKYNTQAAASAFMKTFDGCTGLTSLPADLFRYNTLVGSSGFYKTFNGCTGLTSLPANLFRYNTLVGSSGFYQTFYGCNKLQLNPWIFYASGEESTRFASPVPAQNFESCFELTAAFGGTKGTAPALWDCTFNGTPSKKYCFARHSTYSVDNYGDIPAAWA